MGTGTTKVGGSSKKGRQHGAKGKKYMKQFDRTAKNKTKAWKKHLKKNPTDAKARINIEKLMGKF